MAVRTAVVAGLRNEDGRARGTSQAQEYFADTDSLFAEARAALERLRRQFDLVVLEGAGG